MTAPWTTDFDSAHETTQPDALREALVDKLIAQRAELNRTGTSKETSGPAWRRTGRYPQERPSTVCAALKPICGD